MRLRHRHAFDMRGIRSLAYRKILQEALNACDYPFNRIRRSTKRRIPVTVTDLSRYTDALGQKTHAHVHGAKGHGHLTAGMVGRRRAPLGLYWLPTPDNPAGAIEISNAIMNDPDLAQEVFLAEAAHAVDYGLPLSDEQRKKIFGFYHGGDESAHGDHGWFEESGGQDYWSWVGESFMGGFMMAFADSLPRPLQARQQWKHPTTKEIAQKIRALLK